MKLTGISEVMCMHQATVEFTKTFIFWNIWDTKMPCSNNYLVEIFGFIRIYDQTKFFESYVIGE